MTPYIAEYIGTAVLMILGTGINANVTLKSTYGNQSGWVVTTLGWGFAVFIAVLIAGSISGAHINPAVSIGMAVAGRFEWALVPGYILAQMLGAFTGSTLVYLQYKDHFDATEDNNAKLGVFSTGPAIPNTPRNLYSEVLGTFMLVFPIFYIVAGDCLDSMDSLPVGLLVVVIGMALGGTTGYAINPARDLSPRLVHAVFVKGNSNWSYAWVPVLGPIIGACIAAGVYLLL
jgi:glycerol uptake facilitator protein